MRIKKGDNVIVIAGKDKGKSGKIARSYPRKSTVVIEGVNVQKRHQKPKQSNQKGQIVEKPLPIHISNVMILDPKKNTRSRIGHALKGDKKVRIALKSGTALS